MNNVKANMAEMMLRPSCMTVKAEYMSTLLCDEPGANISKLEMPRKRRKITIYPEDNVLNPKKNP
jgi:hypothetical protein